MKSSTTSAITFLILLVTTLLFNAQVNHGCATTMADGSHKLINTSYTAAGEIAAGVATGAFAIAEFLLGKSEPVVGRPGVGGPAHS